MRSSDDYKWLITTITFALLAVFIAIAIMTNNRIERQTNSGYISQIDSLKTKITECEDIINNYEKQLDRLSLESFICGNKVDSIKFIADSLAAENFRYQYKLGRIQSYINIVNKNSTQSKYLKGWITRALNE